MIKIGLTDFTPTDKIIEIRDKKKVIKVLYAISAKDILKCSLMNEHYIEISFQYDRYIAFRRSDYILWNGSKYTLREDYIPRQENKCKYDYSLKFEAVEMLFQDIQYYYLNQSCKETEWRLAGNPEYFIKIAADNINRYFNVTDFQVGVVEPTEVKDIIFDTNTNIFDALTQIAEAYNSEWYLTGKTINLVKKVSFGSEVDFETEVSILSMSRSEGENSKKYTRILALGSERNLPKDYRGSSTGEEMDAVYSKRLRIPVSKGDFIDAYSDMSTDEIVEGTVIFDEVYPKRVGTIEAVSTIEYTDTDEKTGEVIKWETFKIKDSGINFKEEYLLPEEELRLIFQSGNLNGFDFALKFHKNEFSSTDNSQFFEIVRSDDYGKQLPNNTMKPKVGDKYVLYGYNIALVSDQYVPAGEQELFDTASAWLQKQLQDTSVYDCPTVIDHFKKNEMDLEIGQKIRLIKDIGGGRNLKTNSKTLTGLYAVPNIKATANEEWMRFAMADFSIEILQNANVVVQPDTEYTQSVLFRTDATDVNFNFSWWSAESSHREVKATIEKMGTNTYRAYSTFKTSSKDAKIRCLNIRNIKKSGGTYIEFAYHKFELGNKPTDWTEALEDIGGDIIRSSRIMGYEKKLINKYDATYTVGDNSAYSRLASIEKGLKELQYAGILYENTGSGGVYLIKQFDTTTPSDFNAYSAKASDAKYFNKQTGGGIQGDTLFQKNMQVQGSAISDVFQNSTFSAGQFGSGFQIKRDANGQSYMEVDNLMVRRETVFNKLTIAEIKSLGGTILLSLANMVVSKVEDKTSTWRCYFDNLDGTVPNDFAINDQIICRKFTGKNIKYYWSKVTSVGVNFIEISKTDKDGSGVPDFADEIIQFGNRTDVNRQYAIILSAYGSDAPSIKQYAGINSYDLIGKEVTSISPKGNKFTGSFTISTNGTTAPIYKERNMFVNGSVYYLNDRVSYLGSYWVCIVNSTKTTPSETSLAWRKDTAGQTDINNAFENIQFGGRNLLKELFYKRDWGTDTGEQNWLPIQDTGEKQIKFTCANSTNRLNRWVYINDLISIAPEIGKDYTLSFYYRTDNPNLEFIYFLSYYSDSKRVKLEATDEFKKIIITIRKATNENNNFKSLISFEAPNWTQGQFVEFKALKVETGNKATDWTPAIEDVNEQIRMADQIANQAKRDANTANNFLSDIVSDNKLTPSEKQETMKDWIAIFSEYPKNITQANKLGIITTAYTAAYDTLNTYITPLLSNLGTTSDIIGSTFRDIFKAYYATRADLLNAISLKIKDLADAAQSSANNAQKEAEKVRTEYKSDFVVLNDKIASKVSQTDFNAIGNRLSASESNIVQLSDSIALTAEKVENMQIGGRNLRPNSKTLTGLFAVPNINATANEEWMRFAMADFSIEILQNANVAVQPDTEYTQSVLFRTDATDVNFNFSWWSAESSHREVKAIIDKKGTNTYRAYSTFKTSSKDTKIRCLNIRNIKKSGGTYIEFAYHKFELGNKATDWTPAIEDVDNLIKDTERKATQAKTDASNAQDAANNAQTSANTANLLLSDISSDNKLTPNEKQENKNEWDIIVSEYPKNKAQSNKFGVSCFAYTAAYNALSNYVTPLLSNLTTTSDIDGSTFRATFKAYYDARADLLNAISLKAKDLADAAQTSANDAQKEAEKVRTEYKSDFVVLSDKIASKVSQTDFNTIGKRLSATESNIVQLSDSITFTAEKIENIQFGGRNLLKELFYKRDWGTDTGEQNWLPIQDTGEKQIKFTCANSTNRLNRWVYINDLISIAPEIGKDYTLSFYYRTDNPDLEFIYFLSYYSDSKRVKLEATDEFKKIIITIRKTTNENNNFKSLISFESPNWAQGQFVEFKALKVETGNKATDWTPAIEDVDNLIKDTERKATQAKTVASNAQDAANNAQTTANTANLLLSDISSDNKLTPNEKQENKNEWDIIVSEYPKNKAQSNKFGISSVAYTAAYNALSNYITPLFSNLTTTSDIDGSTFRATFKAYYDARADLLNAISLKAKDLADAAQTSANDAQKEAEKVRTEYKSDFVVLSDKIASKVSQTDFNAIGNRLSASESNIVQLSDSITFTAKKVENMQIGVRNLKPNSKTLTGLYAVPNIKATANEEWMRFAIADFSIEILQNVNVAVQPDTEYTQSVLFRTDATDVNFNFSWWSAESSHREVKAIIDKMGTNTYRAYSTFKTSSKDTKIRCLNIRNIKKSGGTYIEFAYHKFELGNKPTDWTPAIEDVQAGIDSKTTLKEVKSGMEIRPDGVTIFGDKFTVNSDLIANSISAHGLKIGDKETQLSALQVSGDGTFYAKGSTSSNRSLIIDSGKQSIEITSPYSASGDPSGGNPRSSFRKSTVSITSQSGGVQVSNDDYDTSIMSTSGIFANNAGQEMYPASSGISAKAAIVGLGNGNLNVNYSGSNFVAGVHGSALNKGSAPAYGGHFDILKANGLYVSVNRIDRTTTLSRSDCYVSCYNSSDIHLYLPLNPYPGMIIFVRRVNSGDIHIFGNGNKINTAGNELTDIWHKNGRGDTTILIFDGNLWMFNYMVR